MPMTKREIRVGRWYRVDHYGQHNIKAQVVDEVRKDKYLTSVDVVPVVFAETPENEDGSQSVVMVRIKHFLREWNEEEDGPLQEKRMALKHREDTIRDNLIDAGWEPERVAVHGNLYIHFAGTEAERLVEFLTKEGDDE